ncbi:hypothetical protein DPMN_172855 [Dreissena polymorpha]|uniref:C-type lectin domain-containing protein n=1 Tax=Dreissena polymorpha TaxID=45954 RepID=A0A9D4IGF5_DREPO|nr:hypothetical protein DPMN_172855 [Dreissena polymorpha]
MNPTVYLYAVFLIVVKDTIGFKTSKFRRGNVDVEKVCVGNYRVFTHVGVSSITQCATVCSQTIGCDAIFFSAFNGSCTGCKKLTNMSSALAASQANMYYQLVNANIFEWQYGTSRYFLDVSTKMKCTDAEVYCQLFGAHVVVPDSKEEQDFLADRLSKTPTDVYGLCIGIIEASNTNSFLVQHSGKAVNYTAWAPTEPDGNEQCTCSWRADGWKWHDIPCSYMYVDHVVCEHD